MIRVDFKLPFEAKDEQWYKDWLAKVKLRETWFEDWIAFRAKKADEIDLTGEVDPAHLNSEVWRRVKSYLFALFRRKCGYCESWVEHISPGAVDHYRPKSTYMYLAYEITNYIPSCTGCNSGGKGSQFPVVGGTRAHVPGGLAKERPLLLNPCDRAPGRDPAKHLFFISVRRGNELPGHAKGLTREGKETIRLCGLNDRDLLITAREDAQVNAIRDYSTQAAFTDRSPEAIVQLIEKICDPEKPYAAARRDAILDFIETSYQARSKIA
jgi:hypothetical protein